MAMGQNCICPHPPPLLSALSPLQWRNRLQRETSSRSGQQSPREDVSKLGVSTPLGAVLVDNGHRCCRTSTNFTALRRRHGLLASCAPPLFPRRSETVPDFLPVPALTFRRARARVRPRQRPGKHALNRRARRVRLATTRSSLRACPARTATRRSNGPPQPHYSVPWPPRLAIPRRSPVTQSILIQILINYSNLKYTQQPSLPWQRGSTTGTPRSSQWRIRRLSSTCPSYQSGEGISEYCRGGADPAKSSGRSR